jgi:hypothetical protein
MYVDQTMKKRRKASLIVSGLEPVTRKSDSSLFVSLCHDELGNDPVKTVRLGSVSPAVHKVQPLDATDLQSAASTCSSALNPLTGTFIPEVSHDVSSE